MKWKGKINFEGRPQYDGDGLITSAEVDTISGSLQTNIDEKSNNGHIHDDRYYTESEVDELITTIIDDHNELNNLDYASAGHTGFQPVGDYATNSELSSVSGTLQTNIDGKSDTGHIHDDRYYTESEVDTISGSLNTKIEAGEFDSITTDKIIETVVDHIITTSGTETFNLNDGSYHTALVNSDFTVAFSNWPGAGKISYITLKLTNAGDYTITWPGSLDWPGGEEPSWTTASGVDFAVLFSDDGTTIYGTRSIEDIK